MSQNDLNLYAHLARRMNLSPANGRTVMQELNARRVPGVFRLDRAALAERLHEVAQALGAEDWLDQRLNDHLARTVMLQARWADQVTARRAVARQLRWAGMDRASARAYAARALEETAVGWRCAMSVPVLVELQAREAEAGRA